MEDDAYIDLLAKRTDEEINPLVKTLVLSRPVLESEFEQKKIETENVEIQDMEIQKTNMRNTFNDRLLIGSNQGYLLDYSIPTQTYTENKIMDNNISRIAIFYKENMLLVSDVDGHIKQYDIDKKEVVYDYGMLHHKCSIIAISRDDRYFFTADKEKGL